MKSLAWSRRSRWFALVVALVCLAAVALLLCRPSSPAPFMVLRPPMKMPVPLRDYFTRWIPARPSWGWAWRAEQALFGKRKPVNIYGQIFEVSEPSSLWLSKFLRDPPRFSATNGLQVWLLGADQCKRLGEQLSQSAGTAALFRPRISTADGIESRLFQGSSIRLNGTNQPVGLAFVCFARARRSITDLTACITYSEAITNPAATSGSRVASNVVSIQTNLDSALRLQIPKGNGFFLLNGALLSRGKRIGVLVDPP